MENSVSITQLLSELQINGRIAVEVNRQIIPRSAFPTRTIQSGDCVEIVEAVGGG